MHAYYVHASFWDDYYEITSLFIAISTRSKQLTRNDVVIFICLSNVVFPLHCGIEQVRVHGGSCDAITFIIKTLEDVT